MKAHRPDEERRKAGAHPGCVQFRVGCITYTAQLFAGRRPLLSAVAEGGTRFDSVSDCGEMTAALAEMQTCSATHYDTIRDPSGLESVEETLNYLFDRWK